MASRPTAPEKTQRSAEERARPITPWRMVFLGFFVTFLVMLASIYWIIHTGKL